MAIEAANQEFDIQLGHDNASLDDEMVKWGWIRVRHYKNNSVAVQYLDDTFLDEVDTLLDEIGNDFSDISLEKDATYTIDEISLEEYNNSGRSIREAMLDLGIVCASEDIFVNKINKKALDAVKRLKKEYHINVLNWDKGTADKDPMIYLQDGWTIQLHTDNEEYTLWKVQNNSWELVEHSNILLFIVKDNLLV